MLTNNEIASLGPIPIDASGNQVVAEVVARLFESDPHQFGSRPCATCNQVSTVLGRPFGCQRKRET